MEVERGVGKGKHTFVEFSLLHLVVELLLQIALVGVGEFGEVEVGEG